MKRIRQIPAAFATIATACISIQPSMAQAPSAANSAKITMPERLKALDKAITKQAAEAHVSGCSLVVVKDGQVIFLKGFGVRDLEHNKPVTSDTLFAIGSSTKAFTAMTMMMSVDDGKVALNSSPHKYLSYFTLRDKDADARITVSDLMCHRSGLPRTDLAWATGKLTSEEIIRVAGLAKPTAKLGEKFQYQNVMFLAAGQIVGAVQHKPWQDVVATRIFQPLGMNRTETSIARMQHDTDHSLGYAWDEDKQAPYRLPMRDLTCIAPAGAINSSAREMSNWLMLMLNRGVYKGRRLVSEKSFAELYKKRISVSGDIAYGYGWMLRNWHNHPVEEHGGNIDGFSAQVGLMPDMKIGFALLTNANATPFAPGAVNTVFDNLLGAAAKPDETAANAPAVDPAKEAGVYSLEALSVEATVEYKNNGLTLTVPGQPTYKLVSAGGRRYKLQGMPGFTATFRDSKKDAAVTELVIEQPQGTFVAIRNSASASKPEAAYDGPLKELLGTYDNETPHVEFAVAVKHGKVCFIVTGQPAYPLVAIDTDKSGDRYRLGDLPDSFGVTVKRGKDGRVSGIELKQPQGNLNLEKQVAPAAGPSAEEILAKVVEAAGGEASIRKHHSVRITLAGDIENQGVQSRTVEYYREPLCGARQSTIIALGKTIATSHEYYNGVKGGNVSSVEPQKPLSSKELAQAKLEADMHAIADWKTQFKEFAVVKSSKIGTEDVYVIRKTPVSPNLEPITDYVSTRSFLVLKRERSIPTEIGPLTATETFDDYRDIDGVKISFKRTTEVMGNTTVETVDKVEFDVAIPDTVFTAP